MATQKIRIKLKGRMEHNEPELARQDARPDGGGPGAGGRAGRPD